MRLEDVLDLRWRELTAIVEGIKRVGERLMTVRTAISLAPFARLAVPVCFGMFAKETFHHLMP